MKKLLLSSLILVFAVFFSETSMAQQSAHIDSIVIHVTYYHGTIRCHTCLMIEQFSAMTMQSSFGKQIADGAIVWKAEDYEKENDTVAVEKYGLENQALIISKQMNGKETDWQNLPKIWDYVGDYDKFSKYVEERIDSFYH